MANITALKAQIFALERPKDSPPPLALGVGVIDLALGGGLALGAVHELSDDALGAAASLYATVLAAKAGGSVLWCTSTRARDCIYPPGLMELGLDPQHVIQFVARDDRDILWAAHEALRTGRVRTVIAELRRGIDLASARKLQLAAEAGGGLGLFLDFSAGGADALPLVPAAITRWQVSGFSPTLAVPGSPMPQSRHTALRLALVRNRRGALGRWDLLWKVRTRRNERGQKMEQDHATHYFSLVSQTGNQSFHPHQTAMA